MRFLGKLDQLNKLGQFKFMLIVISSQNPVKVNATKQAFKKTFPNQTIDITSLNVDSGVGDQPMTDTETLLGSQNRAHNAQKRHPQADYWIGIEGGVDLIGDTYHSFAWITIKSKTSTSSSKTSTFPLPQSASKLLNQGLELGHAMDYLHNKDNSKQKEGAVGILTHGLVTRTDLYRQATILALIPFQNSSF